MMVIDVIINLEMISTRAIFKTTGLTSFNRFNKVSWTNGNPYNLRWQYKWKHAYYTYPKDGTQPTHIRKPEDTPDVRPPFWTYFQDILYRALPQFRTYWQRRSRIQDPLQIYVLPSLSLFFYQFFELSAGFKIFTFLPIMLFYTRMRDKCNDPDIKETYLRDMIHQNPQISELFKPETIHILDYDLEYDAGYPCEKKFPEFKNKFWRFFNSDTHMCTGFFKFGDLQSGALMQLNFKTMPVHGRFRYQVGEPFFYYDVRAQITHNGVLKEIVLVDQNQILKTKRPFLILV